MGFQKDMRWQAIHNARRRRLLRQVDPELAAELDAEELEATRERVLTNPSGG
jgi:hypothetical protein